MSGSAGSDHEPDPLDVERHLVAEEAARTEYFGRHEAELTTLVRHGEGSTLVLSGRGMFVNHLYLSDHPLDAAQLDTIRRATDDADRAGIEIEVITGPWLTPTDERVLRDEGWSPVDRTGVLVFDLHARPAGDDPSRSVPAVDIEEVTHDTLDDWLAASRLGFGDPDGGIAGARYARASLAMDDPGLLLARDRTSGEAVATSLLSVGGPWAILGGTSTVPSARRRGIQSALIRHRLALAADLGCRWAVSTAVADGDSERNLLRHGFRRTHVRVGWERSVAGVASV